MCDVSEKLDLRKQSVETAIQRVEEGFRLSLMRETLIRKRRTVSASSSKNTWVRIEARPTSRIITHGQVGNGAEAAAFVRGVNKPTWYRTLSWLDTEADLMWRADETELVHATPIQLTGGGDSPALSDTWWHTLNTSLDNVMKAHTTRLATWAGETITQKWITAEIEHFFPNRIDSKITASDWVPAHADLGWANLTEPKCWILDWEDYGLAPRGTDSATLWIGSLAEKDLASRVKHERCADLSTRPGQIMALFHCAQTLRYSSLPHSLVEAVESAAETLLAELKR